MNALIRQIAENGQAGLLYTWVNNAALFIALCYSFWHGKKLGIPFWKDFIILAGAYLGMCVIQIPIQKMLDFFVSTNFLGIENVIGSIVRTFVFFPLFALPIAAALRLKWSLVCDAIAFFPLLKSAFGQLACIFPGCCRGYESVFGIYNPRTGLYHFPMQILETILTLLIFIYLIKQMKDRKYVSNGMLYPEMMTLYGMMRFVCEWLRDNEKLISGCSGISFHAALIFVIGFSVVLYNERKNKKKSTESELIESTDSVLVAETESITPQ